MNPLNLLNTKRPSLLIDTSYFVFYRYYATLNWYRHVNKDIDVSSLLDNTTFVEKYKLMFEKTIVNLVNKQKILWEDVVFCKDAPRDELWRYHYYTEYKRDRDDKQNMFNKDIFKMTYRYLIPELQNKFGFKIVEVSSMEADDIIAVIKTMIRTKEQQIPITIVTNDNDYIQLYDDYTSIVNLQGKELKSRINTEPQQYLKLKIIMGDKSDCIPPIQKSVGPKTAEKLVSSPEMLDTFFKKYPQSKTQYELNKLLIDMKSIPHALKEKIENQIVLI
jgi:DNA polymerase-1